MGHPERTTGYAAKRHGHAWNAFCLLESSSPSRFSPPEKVMMMNQRIEAGILGSLLFFEVLVAIVWLS
jgi:hypothetical protein